jgi:nitroreductase
VGRKLLFILCLFLYPPLPHAQDFKTIQLPPPRMDGGKPLLECLKLRQSAREFNPDRKISLQGLADLLWAADGVNRPDGKRTAPSAVNWQNMDIYLATVDGLFLYDAPQHVLKTLASKDVRSSTGEQPFVKDASLNLIYVADFYKAKQTGGSGENLPVSEWSFAAAGAIAQNVYLFCASEGLSTVMRTTIDKNKLAKILKLRPDQNIILTQSVGYSRR